jgi:hypothetical protein
MRIVRVMVIEGIKGAGIQVKDFKDGSQKWHTKSSRTAKRFAMTELEHHATDVRHNHS